MPTQCEGLPSETYGFYVLGTLEDPDREQLSSHLERSCAHCQTELTEARRMWHGVALAAPQVEPRRALRGRVIASVRDPERFRSAWWHPVAALAALAIAVFVGTEIGAARHVLPPLVQILPAPGIHALERENQALRTALAAANRAPAALPAPAQRPPAPQAQDNSAALAELSKQRDQLANVQQELAAAQTRAEQLERDLVQYKGLLTTARQRLESPNPAASLLADPNLKVVRLRGTTRDSSAEGHVLVAGGSQVMFYGSRLPSLPAGRTYQLWLIRASAPAIVSAGVFRPDARQRAMVQFNSAALTSGVTTIAITDEPEGGSPLPTGHKLLVGS